MLDIRRATGTKLITAAFAASAVGIFAVPATGHAQPPMMPTAPACSAYQFIGIFGLKQHDGWRAELPPMASDPKGPGSPRRARVAKSCTETSSTATSITATSRYPSVGPTTGIAPTPAMSMTRVSSTAPSSITRRTGTWRRRRRGGMLQPARVPGCIRHPRAAARSLGGRAELSRRQLIP